MIGRWWAAALAAVLCPLDAAIAAEREAGPDATLEPYGSLEHSVTLPDGRSIHMVCMGEGSPTVVLTSGLGDWSVTWSRVQPKVAATTRACAWDRPGFGLSSASPLPQTIDNTTADLETALARSGIAGPYVLVGHSLGGYETLLFADRNPAKVAGMVLVDPSIPGQAAILARNTPKLEAWLRVRDDGFIALLRRCATDLRSGKVAPGKPDPDGCLAQSPALPPQVSQALIQAQTDPAVFDTMISRLETFDGDSERVINPSRSYGATPLIVLTATTLPEMPMPPEVRKEGVQFLEAFERGHADIAALSTRGVRRTVPDAPHYIHQAKPEAVIEAIETVIARARAARRPSTGP